MSETIPSAEQVLATLRTFQRATAVYAFSRLYDPEQPSLRFLVADEVGLGKTLVARGVIAQAVERLRALKDKRIDIVYICSNGAIARQNLRKLNIAGEEATIEADRFTLLANKMDALDDREINLVAVTPGTSLSFGKSAGKFQERALLFAILRRLWGKEALRGSGPARLFYLGINDDRNARQRLRAKAAKQDPAPAVVRAFRAEIRRLNEHRRQEGRPTVKVEFNGLARAFQYKGRITKEDRLQRNRFIVELRQALATVGIEALQPDLVILDEFQRFRDLLDPANQSWATRLAHKLFDFRASDTGRPTRTLLLSATPYRPYTTADDTDGDAHFADFVQTARFLLGDDLSTEALRADLRDLRRSLLAIDRDKGAAAAAACERVGARLRPVMARTERLASTPDRNGMLATRTLPMTLEQSDVDGYLAAATAARMLGDRDVVEFWKSAPYLLNFMEGYALKHAFEDAAEAGSALPDLSALVAGGRGLLDWEEVERYGRVDPANARLRALTGDTIGRGLWRLLWLPPALPYYDADGVFEAPEARTFTKRLVFSAWKLVPKVVSAYLSYEAERHAFGTGGAEARRRYTEYAQRPDRLLDFRMDGRAPGAMAALNIVVPWLTLARIVDPLTIALEHASDRPNRAEIETQAAALVEKRVKRLLAGVPDSGPVDQRWYWAASLMMDIAADREGTLAWWQEAATSAVWTGEAVDSADGGTFERHLELAEQFVTYGPEEPLGRPPDDLVEVLTAVALGSPAVCALRALARVSGTPPSHDSATMQGAARIAWGFRALFNSPDATAIVRAQTEPEAYWRAALDYAVAGNLQAVLDEYLHVLKDWRGFLTDAGEDMVRDIAETAHDALSLRTVNYRTDVPRARDGAITVERHSMRGRFAIRFGDQAIEGEEQQQRAQQASQAFNSPFWPFVMTTTSVGQEGLDFHLYSHAVVHWNLPANPVDFEQREGRVHRYKGHAVRKNVAHVCGTGLSVPKRVDPWRVMFNAASAGNAASGELSPYWVFAPPGAPARIERYVPVFPFSRDASRLGYLLEAVATYRLSFGQPRQEELLQFLGVRVLNDEPPLNIDRIKVDLRPDLLLSGP